MSCIDNTHPDYWNSVAEIYPWCAQFSDVNNSSNDVTNIICDVTPPANWTVEPDDTLLYIEKVLLSLLIFDDVLY